MRVCAYTLAGHRHRTMRPGSCVWHRINMQVDAPIAIGRSRSTQDALRHPRRYSDIKSTYMMQCEARMTRGIGLRIMCHICQLSMLRIICHMCH